MTNKKHWEELDSTDASCCAINMRYDRNGMQLRAEQADHVKQYRRGEKNRRQKKTLLGKFLFSFLIVSAYLFCKKIHIPWVVAVENGNTEHGMQAFIRSAMGNNSDAGTVMAVGFMPYITAMVVISLFHSIRQNKKTSGRRRLNQVRVLTLLLAVLQAAIRTMRVDYAASYSLPIPVLNAMTMIVLVAGAFSMVWMSERCQKWGIGGTSVLILVNVVQNLWSTGLRSVEELGEQGINPVITVLVASLVSFLIILITVLMERSELHVNIKRIMIHNSFGGESHLAVKLNPVGTMAVMYVMTLFALPYYICSLYIFLFGENRVVVAVQRNLNLQSIGGILLFMFLLATLNCALARIQINPEDIADELQKSGDYIPGIHPGKDTKFCISKMVWFASIVSSVVSCIIIIPPLILQEQTELSSSIFLLPMSVMILTGIVLGILEEIHTVDIINRYRRETLWL